MGERKELEELSKELDKQAAAVAKDLRQEVAAHKRTVAEHKRMLYTSGQHRELRDFMKAQENIFVPSFQKDDVKEDHFDDASTVASESVRPATRPQAKLQGELRPKSNFLSEKHEMANFT